MVRVDATLRQNETGRSAVVGYDTEEQFIDSTPYMWLEGNYSCDCNRDDFFRNAIGEPSDDEIDCGETAYTLLKLVIDGVEQDITPPVYVARRRDNQEAGGDGNTVPA